MTPSLVAAVFCGGALGSVARYACGLAEAYFFRSAEHPTDGRGTLCANLIACFVVGFLFARDVSGGLGNAFLIAGLCGGLSTFSSFALELLDWLEQRRFGRAAVFVLAACVGGFATMWLGSVIA